MFIGGHIRYSISIEQIKLNKPFSAVLFFLLFTVVVVGGGLYIGCNASGRSYIGENSLC
jgi:hypothetical protein